MTKSLLITIFALTGFFLDSRVSDMDYCSSTGTDTTHEYIDHIQLNQINNISGNNLGYADFTGLETDLMIGHSYEMFLTPGYAENEFNESWKVWIDYNQDGDFEDEGEEAIATKAIGQITGEISIPENAIIGSTRMRISMRYNNPATSCLTFTFGEVEDYSITIKEDSPCEDILTDSFEEDYGIWIDGGDDCTRVKEHASQGEWSVRLRDDTGAKSSMTTKSLELADVEQLAINFSYFPNSMEDGESYSLLISTNGGQTYTNIKRWQSGKDFTNGTHYKENITVDDITFTDQTSIRIMCDASANADQIFIDEISIQKCSYIDSSEDDYKNNLVAKKAGELDDVKTDFLPSKEKLQSDKIEIDIYPNPTQDKVSFSTTNQLPTTDQYNLRLLDMQGEVIISVNSISNIDDYVLDITDIYGGMYFLIIEMNEQIVEKHKILVSK